MSQKRLDPRPGQTSQQGSGPLTIDSDAFVEDVWSSRETGAGERQCEGG
jgi:hypothetical protein